MIRSEIFFPYLHLKNDLNFSFCKKDSTSYQDMGINQNFENIKNILLQPISGWQLVDIKSIDLKSFFIKQVLGLLLLIFIVKFVGKSLEFLYVSSIYYILVYTIFSLISEFISFVISVLIVNKLLPSYGISVNKPKIAVLIYYSLIPYYIFSALVSLFPSMYFFGIISIYGFIIYWFGVNSLLKIKDEDSLIFFVVSIILILGIHLLLRFIVILPFFEIL